MSWVDDFIKNLPNARLAYSGGGVVFTVNNLPVYLVYMESKSLKMFKYVYNGDTGYIFKGWWFDRKFNKLKKIYDKRLHELEIENIIKIPSY